MARRPRRGRRRARTNTGCTGPEAMTAPSILPSTSSFWWTSTDARSPSAPSPLAVRSWIHSRSNPTMAATIIDGRGIAEKLRVEIRAEAEAVRAQLGINPRLAFVLIGDDPAARSYVTSKSKAAAKLGIDTEDYPLPAAVQQPDLLRL